MADHFDTRADSVFAPSRKPFAITPSDTAEISPLPKALYIGTGGDVTLRGVDASQDVVLKNVASGDRIEVRAMYVRATGTTAQDIVGLA
ncbi:MAG TPA: hypothetical protein VF418_08270 [Sphingomonadaceae bacterium]